MAWPTLPGICLGATETMGRDTTPATAAHPRPPCPVCGAGSWSSPLRATRLRMCSVCGTVLNDRSPSRKEEERIYESYSSAPKPEEAPIGAAQWQWVTRTLRPVAAGERLAVLDIGCGHGGFLTAARDSGAQVAGVELDPAGVATCRALGLPVEHGSVFDTGLPPGTWDVITMWDVLEHLEFPRRALELALPGLCPGGLLVVRGRNARFHVPWKAAYARCRGPMRRLHLRDLSCVHRWGFGPAAYARLLRETGLAEIRLHPGIPTPGDRSGALGPRQLARGVKALLRVAGVLAYHASLHHVYLFPSVLVSGRKPGA